MENQKLFIGLASILNAKGANISMETSFQDDKIIYSDVPEVRGYMGPEGDGYYFRANHKYFGISEVEIAESFPLRFDDYMVRMVSFSEFEIEHDGDRFYPESFSFIIEKIA
jgi:hypothetical protein